MRTSHGIALIALGLTFVAAFFASAFVFSLHPSSAGLVVDIHVDTYGCDQVLAIVLTGQGGPWVIEGEGVSQAEVDPEFAAWCADMATVPAIIGFVVATIGLAAAIAWVILFRRMRRERKYGRPISKARSHLGLPGAEPPLDHD